MKKKGGRPKKKDNEKLKHVITFKVNDEENAKLQEWASESGEPVSQIIRDALFKGKIEIVKNETLGLEIEFFLCNIKNHIEDTIHDLEKERDDTSTQNNTDSYQELLLFFDEAIKELRKAEEETLECITIIRQAYE